MTVAEAVVLYSPSQAGKSTLVQYLTDGGEAVRVGEGDGESVTAEATLYRQTKLGRPVLDTTGINDSMLRFTNDQAGQKVALAVASAGVRALNFVVMDSLANDTIQLRNTLVEFKAAFGDAALPSVVVMASKADCCPEAKKGRRLSSIREIAGMQGISQVLEWQSEGVSAEGMREQLQRLDRALLSVPAVQTRDLEDLHNRVEARARRLLEEAPAQQKTVMMDEPYVEEYPDVEEYDEPYTRWENTEVQETVQEPYATTVTKEVSTAYLERGPTLGKILTLGMGFQDQLRHSSKTVEVPVTEYRTVTRTRTVQVPVTDFRKASRAVTRQRTKTRQVERTVEVELHLEHFMDRAMAEIKEEMRSALAPRASAGAAAPGDA